MSAPNTLSDLKGLLLPVTPPHTLLCYKHAELQHYNGMESTPSSRVAKSPATAENKPKHSRPEAGMKEKHYLPLEGLR